MELFPALALGWLNGWILIGLLYLIYIIVLLILPKDVVARLYDKAGRSKRHKVLVYAGSFFSFSGRIKVRLVHSLFKVRVKKYLMPQREIVEATLDHLRSFLL